MFYDKNKPKELSDELFKNPSSEYRGAPFWAWNCDLSEDILNEQIEYLKDMGFGGFHMHSRTGMAVPYLGERFKSLVKFCTDKAKSEGMKAYLYDEDRWPSGAAGGLVTKNPKYRARYIEFTQKHEEHFPKDIAENEGKTYLLGVYDIVLNSVGELDKYIKIDENDAAEGQKWYVYIKTSKNDPWYNNQTYVDTLNKEAIDEFINITYNSYEKAVGDEFGKTVPSIFTDEPQFTQKRPLGFADSRDSAFFPWTFSLEESFRENYGYDISDNLPEIVWNLKHGAVSATRYRYHNHVSEMFTQSFADNCGAWCNEHGIALTGHMMEEPTLHSQTSALGETMRSYRAFAVPGIDMLCDRIEFSTAKQCQSAVHQYGREAMISELYGVTNWDFDFRGHKFQGDWQAALGVTIRVPHLAWVSMAGEAKRDYPASINYQSPWYKEYKYIEDHFARVHTALTRGKPVVRVGVIHPIESYWINFGPEENTFDIRTQLDEKFKNLIDWLLFGTIDFDFISESLLPDQFGGADGKLKVGEMEYDAVLVPDCITIRKTTLAILNKFVQNGGKVIFAGKVPKYVDAIDDNSAVSLYEKSEKVQFDKIDILNSLKEYRTVRIMNSDGSPTSNLIYNMREDNSCKWLFIAHGSKDICDPVFEATKTKEYSLPQNIRIYVSGKYSVQLYDTLSGEIRTLKSELKNGNTVVDFELFSSDSILLKLCDNIKNVCISDAVSKKPSRVMRISDNVLIKRTEPNVLLLDRAEYSLNGEPFRPEDEILILDNECRERLGLPLRSDVFAQPWVVGEEPPTDCLTLKFKIESEIEVHNAKLAIEDAEKLKISFNGKEISNKADGWFVDKAIKTVPLPTVNKGKNELLVTMPFGKRTSTEWCYILGEFGVKTIGAFSSLTYLPDKYGFSSLTHQGMPFYGGNVIYETEIETPECDAVIGANYYRGALIKVIVDGEEKGIIAFAPYKLKVCGLSAGRHKIEFVLFGTRINTFGGMHNVVCPQWTGPNFWRSQGDQWCYEYLLKDTGILASPIIEIYDN